MWFGIRTITEILLDAMYPRRCPVCGEIVMPAGHLICPGCVGKLSWISGPVCKKCGKPVNTRETEYCPDCLRRPGDFEYGIALCCYDDVTRASMAKIKYQGRREYLDFYGAAMAARLGKKILNMRPDVLVPVPVHPARRRRRGFNQAEILAQRLSERLEEVSGVRIPVESAWLLRTKKTLPQKELSPGERRKNLEQAFAPGAIPKDARSVVLIDDIYTTGSTVQACTKVLKNAGIQKVYTAVICIGSQ